MNYPCSSCKKECLAEFLGTYLLVLVGPGSVVVASVLFYRNPEGALLFTASAFAGIVGLVILMLGRYSAQINPAITLAHTLTRLSHRELLIPYVCFQILGCLLAGPTLWLILGTMDRSGNLGSTQLARGIDPIFGILLEAVGTFVLSTCALLASSGIRSHLKQAMLIGMTLFVLIVLVGPLTGASFNPARSLGPSVASGYLNGQYIYWIGPFIGALLSALAFRIIRNEGKRLRSVCMC